MQQLTNKQKNKMKKNLIIKEEEKQREKQEDLINFNDGVYF